MALEKYKQKRSFASTPEPEGGKGGGKELHFVVQKHDASRLHYDFRLEMEGVLKSWAVPKGPSMNPEDKRLAMMVEDHPYDYKDFEGIIPEGNYGAGTVIVWDEGMYAPLDDATEREAQEKSLLKQLKAGSLKFALKGKKLKGEFALVKTRGMGENAWLLIKHRDQYASDADITRKDKSVLSGKKIGQVAAQPQKEWKSNRAQRVSAGAAVSKKVSGKAGNKTHSPKAAGKIGTKAHPKKTARMDEKEGQEEQEDSTNIHAFLRKGKNATMPRNVKPMLATLTPKPFDLDDWIYEIKWDGYRAVAYLNNGKASLLSRNLLSFNEKFGIIATALKAWKTRAVIDGEIVAVNEKGEPDFQALQNYLKEGKSAHLIYYAFDLLWYEDLDLTGLPLLERKAILEHILPKEDPSVAYCDHISGQGTEFFNAALKRGLEGIMAKKADSPYTIGKRSDHWLKIKNNKRMEAIICGYTAPRNSRKHFGAVILGKYEGGELRYIGHTGGGFDEKSLRLLFSKFRPLIRKTCPFRIRPRTNMPATWLKPELVCEVKFSQVTAEGSLRQPIFLGLREDKTAASEKNEKIVAPPGEGRKASSRERTFVKTTAKKTAPKKVAAPERKAASRKNTGLLIPEDEKEIELTIDGQALKFTNLDKLYWPDEHITKRDMLNYYDAISPYILPYLKDRPQSLNRHPDGIKKQGFYQKDVKGKVAAWIETFPYQSESENETLHFLVCKNKATLLYMANLGCIEMNPWHSRIGKPDQPDYCLIDLDPDKTNTFNQVIETALVVKEVLDNIGVTSFVKTTGSTGIHILLPLGARYSYDQSRMLAELIVGFVHKQLPKFTSLERNPAKRKGKIYLDYLQNRQIQTMAAAYSLRPKPGATVSAPLHWEEVKKGLKIADFNLFNMQDRVKREGDLLKGLLGKGINLDRWFRKMQGLMK